MANLLFCIVLLRKLKWNIAILLRQLAKRRNILKVGMVLVIARDGRVGFWDNRVRGAGPPPIKTKEGWLLFYHAIDMREPSKYKLGAMILDLNDPTKILYRTKKSSFGAR